MHLDLLNCILYTIELYKGTEKLNILEVIDVFNYYLEVLFEMHPHMQ
jgi:hypothetical protein